MFIKALSLVFVVALVACSQGDTHISYYPVEHVFTLDEEFYNVRDIAWNTSQNILAIGDHLATYLYDLNTETSVLLRDEVGVGNSIRWNSDQNLLAGATRTVWIFDITNNINSNLSDNPPDFRFYAQVSWNLDSSIISAIYVEPRPEPQELRIWRLTNIEIGNTNYQTLDNVMYYGWGANDTLAFSRQDGTSVYLISNISSLPIELYGHTGEITAIAWNSTGTQLASTSENGELYIWDNEASRITATIQGLSERVRAMKWHESGRVIATASENGINLWCVNTGESTIVHTYPSYALDWNSEDSLLATVRESELVIYDVSEFVDNC